MIAFRKSAGIAGLVALIFASAASVVPASAGEAVEESQATVTQLGTNVSALTYWVSDSDGWHVVTTVDTAVGQGGDAEHHAVVRFSAVLQPGQSQLVSVPVAVGEPQQALRIQRIGDRIEVTRVAGAV